MVVLYRMPFICSQRTQLIMAGIKVIYLAGASFSGSTVLGYILGSSPRVFNAGELKFYSTITGMPGEYCTCGKESGKCPFWKRILAKKLWIVGNAGFFKEMLDYVRARFGSRTEGEEELLGLILAQERKSNSRAEYVVDASKSLGRLMALAACPQVDLRVLYIRRDIQGNVGSFVRHGYGFWNGLLRYLLNNSLTRLYLGTSNLKWHPVDYEELCKKPEKTMKSVGRFLGIDYSGYRVDIRKRDYHVPTGNRAARQSFSDWKGLKYDDSWKRRLSPFQKKVLGFFG